MTSDMSLKHARRLALAAQGFNGRSPPASIKASHVTQMIERAYKSVKHHVSRWYELQHQRRQLAGLSDEALKDLGLSRADVYRETEQHFWNDTMNR